MDTYGIGMMAKSLAGHDRGKTYMIKDFDEKFVYLVDGSIKTLDKPKKKKWKHVQIDRNVSRWIANLLKEEKEIHDSDVIRAIREYNK